MSENYTLGARVLHRAATLHGVVELAQSHNFKRVGSEWHGANPTGNGATTDGYILNDDGTSYDRKLDQHFTSTETARNFGIDPAQYEPVANFRNGHALSFNRAGAPRKVLDPATRNGNGSKPKPDKGKPTKETVYDYTKDGELLFQTIRREYSDGPKDFTQRRPDTRGGWIYNLQTIAPVLYHHDALKATRVVIICEGEKAADLVNAWLKAAGLYGEFVATTNPMGAGKWRDEYSQVLTGKHVSILPDNDEVGRRHAAKIVQSLTGKAASIKVVELRGLPEKGDAIEYSAAGNTLENLLAEIDAAPEASTQKDEFIFEYSTDEAYDERLTGIQWGWPGYVPRGFLTALVGDQDQGKSTVALSLCDIYLRGARWPDGQPHTPKPETKLLLIDTEGAAAVNHERMKSWGMPRGRFILPPDPLQELAIDDPKAWQWIEAAIEKFQPPLVVVDSLSGAHNAKENGNDEMKPIMKRLSSLAQKHQIAVIVIHHLSKPAPGVPSHPITIHRLRGASAISQYCRSILALSSPDSNAPEKRRLDVIKLNLARKPAPVGYELTDLGPAWGEAPEAPKPHRAADDAIDFLRDALANGPRPSEEIEAERNAQGIGYNALNAAKKALGVKAKREGGKDGGWFLVPPASFGSGEPAEPAETEPKEFSQDAIPKTVDSLNPLNGSSQREGQEFKEFKESHCLGIGSSEDVEVF